MKARFFTAAAVLMLSVALMGCSANREAPMNSMDTRPSATTPLPSANVPNDATQGGGAGGTNDRNNDGQPDALPKTSDQVGNDRGGVMDDVGNAAGDLIEGAGDAARDVGDAIGDAAGDANRSMRR